MAGLRNALQLRAAQTQTLTMTPQLQQAIRLLQLSTLDLRQEIQQTVESNPLLEVDETIANANLESLDEMAEQEYHQDQSEVFDPFSNDNQGSDLQFTGLGDHNEVQSTADLLNRNNIDHDGEDRGISNNERLNETSLEDTHGLEEFINQPEVESINDNLPDRIAKTDIDPGSCSTQENPDNILQEDNCSARTRSKNNLLGNDTPYEGETHIDLRDHLTWQLDCSPLVGRDRVIAEAIIDAIDDSGYLQESIENILSVVTDYYHETTEEDVLVILKLIQHYDPLGVGSRNVQECLLIQLQEMALHDNSEYMRLALVIVRDYLDLLSNHDYKGLCTRLGIKEDVLKEVNRIIVGLHPRPGHSAVKEQSDFIIPDVVVVKDKNDEYDVILNPDALPRVRLNEQYKSLVSYARNEREKEFFKSNLQEANWFIQSIAKRNDTLLKVSRCIIQHQRAFLDYGENRMEPMVLNDIAQEIEMHESTISRVTTEKYIYTPRGTYELKYFFSSHVSTESGGTASSTAIRAEIKAIIAEENASRPYSDNQIANLLKDKGFCVARRTIAKYREALGIGPSAQRKRLV